MNRFISSCLLATALSAFSWATTKAQTVPDTIWRHNIIAGLNLTEVAFSHWQPGGTNALNYIAGINGKSTMDQPMTNLTNNYKLTFGQTKIGDLGLRKTDDEINLESILTYKIGVHINPYAAASLLTQFAPGYQYSDTAQPVAVSNFFDPAYLKQSVGVGFTLSPKFTTRLGVALREILTNKYNIYANDPSEPGIHRTRIQGGLESVTELELPIEDNVLIRSKLELFAPLKTLDRIVVHGQTTLVGKISKYFSAELNALFVQEPDISPFTQIKQGLSIGIVYAIL